VAIRNEWRKSVGQISLRPILRFDITGLFSPLCRAEHRRVWTDKSAGLPICMHSTRRARYMDVPSEQPVRGDAWMRRVACRGWEAPSGNPVQTLRPAGSKRHWGGFFFGYFLLAKQKKVSRLSGRQIGRIADLHAEHPQGDTHGCVS